jgi:beta-phosphoglucomutase-like phosphatase (HAD superfamily)
LHEAGIEPDPDEIEQWIDREKRAVTAHLSGVLTVDEDVRAAVSRLAGCFDLAVVSSSARSRLDACFAATGLDEWFSPDRRFSAEDSLPTPVSKPDPAIYLHALRVLGVDPRRAVAVEDSAAGVEAAVRAGIPAAGIVVFVPEDERRDRTLDLMDAGAVSVAPTWAELVERLLPTASRC